MRIVLVIVLMAIALSLPAENLWDSHRDKPIHFAGSVVTTVWLTGFNENIINMEKSEAIIYGSIMTLNLGLLKELNDKYISNTHWDWCDVLADCAGIAVGVIFYNNVIK